MLDLEHDAGIDVDDHDPPILVSELTHKAADDPEALTWLADFNQCAGHALMEVSLRR